MISIGYRFKTSGAVVLATAPADKDSIIVLCKQRYAVHQPYITGRVYVTQLPHPEEWNNGTYSATVEDAVEHFIDRAMFGTISNDQVRYLRQLIRNTEDQVVRNAQDQIGAMNA